MTSDLPRTAAGLNDLALDLLARGSADEALATWRQALELDPLHAESLVNSTLVSWRLGRETDEDAVARLERWRAATGGEGSARVSLGLVQLERRDLESAEALLRGTDDVRDQPSDVAALLQAARTQGAFGRTGLLRLEHPSGAPGPIALTEDGCVLLVGEGNDVVLRRPSDLTEITRLTGHTGRAETLAVTPDGQWAASGGEHDATLWIWDLRAPGQSRAFADPDIGPVLSVTLSADGRQAVTVSLEPKCAEPIRRQSQAMADAIQRDAEVREAELQASLQRGDPLPVFRPPANLGSYIRPSDFPRDRVVHLWDLASGAARVIERGSAAANRVRFSPDGSRVVVATTDTWHPDPNRQTANVAPLRIRDVARQSAPPVDLSAAIAVAAGATQPARPPAGLGPGDVLGPRLALDRGGRCALWAVPRDGSSSLRVQDLTSGRCLRTVDIGHPLDAVAMSGDARTAVTAWRGGALLEVWRLPPSWEPVAPLRRSSVRPSAAVRFAESSPGELRAKAESAMARRDFEEARIQLVALRERAGFERSEDSLRSWARLYPHCPHEELRACWIVREWTGRDGLACLAPDGTSIARPDEANDAVILEDPRTGRLLRRLKGVGSGISSLDFSDNMRYLAAGSYAAIVVWDLGRGRARVHSVRHFADISGLRIADDGRRARFSYRGQTLVWDGSEKTRGSSDPLSETLARGERPLGAMGDGRWRFEVERPPGPLALFDARTGTRRILVPDPVQRGQVTRYGEWLLTLEPTSAPLDRRTCLRFLDWRLGPSLEASR